MANTTDKFVLPDAEDLYKTMVKEYQGSNPNRAYSFGKYFNKLPSQIYGDAARKLYAEDMNCLSYDGEYALSKEDVVTAYLDSVMKELGKVPIQPLVQATNSVEYNMGVTLNAATELTGEIYHVSGIEIDRLTRSYVEKKIQSTTSLTTKEKKTLEALLDLSRNQYSSLHGHSAIYGIENGKMVPYGYLSEILDEMMTVNNEAKALAELLIYGTSRLVPDAHPTNESPLSGSPLLQEIEQTVYVPKEVEYKESTTISTTTTSKKTTSTGQQEQTSLEKLFANNNAEDILAYINQYSTKILDYDLTPNKYFCGNDAYVFFNGVRVGDVTYIDWELKEKKQPIFGYASYTFDDIAVGTRQVEGRISVNFTKTKYIDGILKYSQENIKDSNGEAETNVNSVVDVLNSMSSVAEKKQYVKNIFNNQDSEELTKVINELEAMMLNTTIEQGIVDKSQQPYFNNPNQDGSHQGFTIMIPWGDELFKMAGLESNGNETLTIINDVYITSESSSVTIEAGNVQQVFTYIARDLNNTVLTNAEKRDIYLAAQQKT